MKKKECKVIVKHAVDYLREKFHLEGWDFEYKVKFFEDDNQRYATNFIDTNNFKSKIKINCAHKDHNSVFGVFRTIIHEFVHILKDKEDTNISIVKESYFNDNEAMAKVLYDDKEKFIEWIAKTLAEAWFEDFQFKRLVERNKNSG